MIYHVFFSLHFLRSRFSCLTGYIARLSCGRSEEVEENFVEIVESGYTMVSRVKYTIIFAISRRQILINMGLGMTKKSHLAVTITNDCK